MWEGVIGKDLGESKDEVHRRHKESFLLPILERDDAGFAVMMETVRDLYRKGQQAQARQAHRVIVDLSSTTRLNVEQMTEFLNEIEQEARGLNIRLPYPDDFHRTMGRAA